MWNGIKREDFGRAVVFTVVCGWVVRFLTQTAVFLSSLFLKSLLQTLCDLFLNRLFFYLSYYCPRASNQLYSISMTAHSELSTVAFLLKTQSVITLIITLAIIINTIAVNFDHRRYFDPSICLSLETLGKSEHSLFHSIPDWIWL